MSSPASVCFLSCIVLGIICIIALLRSYQSRYVALAFIPGTLCLSECFKGLEWLSDKSKYLVVDHAALAYLFINMAVLPLLWPLSFLVSEKNPMKRKKLKILLLVGGILTLYFMANLVIFDVGATGSDGHLRFIAEFPDGSLPVFQLFYVIVMTIPGIVAGTAKSMLLSIVFNVSYLTSLFYFQDSLPQISSIFAIAIGLNILWIVFPSTRKKELRII